MNRLEFLQSAQEFLDSIENINLGGCGLSALALYRFLLRGGFDVSDVYFYEDYSIGHILLCLDRDCTWLDSEGNYAPSRNSGTRYTEAELVSELNIPQWNGRFDRERWYAEIELELDIDLSDVAVTFSHGTPVFKHELGAGA